MVLLSANVLREDENVYTVTVPDLNLTTQASSHGAALGEAAHLIAEILCSEGRPMSTSWVLPYEVPHHGYFVALSSWDDANVVLKAREL